MRPKIDVMKREWKNLEFWDSLDNASHLRQSQRSKNEGGYEGMKQKMPDI